MLSPGCSTYSSYPSGEADHELVGHEGEEWLYGMEGCIEIEYGSTVMTNGSM